MAASPALKPSAKPTKPKLGLRSWMLRVLDECDRADKGFDAEAVHDLRVALRRCRSLADGLIALDPDSSWKDMKKAGKKVFQALGGLRDMQVMEEWIEKLRNANGTNHRADHPADDPVTASLFHHIQSREADCKQLARQNLDQFDRKQWRQWSRTLPRRAARARPGSLVYMHLALEKWVEAYDLHKRAVRTRSTVGWHALRIGIKHFRYTVENFLPQQHAWWGDDLKELQDLLGEVHDLDVLWATAVSSDVNAFPDVASRRQWREKLNAERNKRLARYREKMVGKQSLWRVWRAELPSGPQLHAAAMSRLRTWAGYLDPDFVHSQRVAQLSLQLYDELRNAGLVTAEQGLSATNVSNLIARNISSPSTGYDPRAVLQAATFMHDVGKAKRLKNHQKKSYRMIRSMERPLGWSAHEMELAAAVARYHRGALPRPQSKIVQRLELPDRPTATLLAGILRLAVALEVGSGRNERKRARASRSDAEIRAHRSESRSEKRSGKVSEKRVEVHLQENFVIVRAEGYSALERSAEGIAAARHLLEMVLRRPILVRPLRPSAIRGRSSVRGAGDGGASDKKIIGRSIRQKSTGDDNKAA